MDDYGNRCQGIMWVIEGGLLFVKTYVLHMLGIYVTNVIS